jgi:hypothetical protein
MDLKKNPLYNPNGACDGSLYNQAKIISISGMYGGSCLGKFYKMILNKIASKLDLQHFFDLFKFSF